MWFFLSSQCLLNKKFLNPHCAMLYSFSTLNVYSFSHAVKIYFFVGFYCFFGLFCILTTFKHRFEMKKPASALADAGHLSG